MSNWSELVNYINNLSNGDKFYRKKLLSYISNSASIDVYRRSLTLCGYISTDSVGTFIKLDDIPLDLTSTLANKLAYNNLELLKYKRKKKIRTILNEL